MSRYHLIHGDSAEWLAKMKPESVDALVCDPPAGISFMGKAWDQDYGHRNEWIKAFAAIFRLALTAMKPGAHGLVWALPRTSHWTATALEDAGFEVRDVVMHLFGTGFPKSLDVEKATGDACFKGWGTALKPAAEHWILVRKPLDGTVAENVLTHGTGGLNIDACRIGETKNVPASVSRTPNVVYGDLSRKDEGSDGHNPNIGRWPANVTLDEEAAAALDAQSGTLTSGRVTKTYDATMEESVALGKKRRALDPAKVISDSGGASRFFYVAKAARSEREAGLDDLPVRTGGEATGREDGSAGLQSPRAGAGRGGGRRNHHPTVKSVALMRWLCRLVTPSGGIILDPFMGSGSTGVAALAEGFRFIGIEREAEYVEIAKRRIAHAERGE